MEVGTFAAVIFDFDGTIGDSHAAMIRAYVKWAQEYDIDPQRLTEFTGVPSYTIAQAVVAPELVDEAAARIEELECSDAEGVVALPGAQEAFEAIPDQRRAIATSCTRPLIEVRLPATGLPRPSVVVSRDDVEYGKPAPDSFLAAAARLGVDPAQCLVCEDAPAGVAAARAAGMAVLGIMTTHTAEELGANWHVRDLSEVTFKDTPAGVLLSVA